MPYRPARRPASDRPCERATPRLDCGAPRAAQYLAAYRSDRRGRRSGYPSARRIPEALGGAQRAVIVDGVLAAPLLDLAGVGPLQRLAALLVVDRHVVEGLRREIDALVFGLAAQVTLRVEELCALGDGIVLLVALDLVGLGAQVAGRVLEAHAGRQRRIRVVILDRRHRDGVLPTTAAALHLSRSLGIGVGCHGRLVEIAGRIFDQKGVVSHQGLVGAPMSTFGWTIGASSHAGLSLDPAGLAVDAAGVHLPSS